MSEKTSKYFPTTTYSVKDKSVLRIGDQEYDNNLSYNLYIETDENEYVIITRTNLKANEEKINTKFLDISNRYMESLFPLVCKIENYRLLVTNHSEIKNRIEKEDVKVMDQYSGEGVDHIRSQFFAATETKEKLSEFIKQLHFMKVLNLGMQKFEQREDYYLQWNVLPITLSKWKGEIKYSKDNKNLTYEPKIDNAQEIMDEVINYIHKHDYIVDFEEENVGLFTDFNHDVSYTGETGRMSTAETKIEIKVENKFLYQQIIQFNKI